MIVTTIMCKCLVMILLNNVAREHFDIALWFSLLDYMAKTNNVLIRMVEEWKLLIYLGS